MEDKDLQILIKAAHAGGEVLRKYFGKALNIVEKSTVADFQTEADTESEKAIIEIIKKELPLYNIQSEEEGKTNKDSDYTVVIDPLDGTYNFILGIPYFSVSIALLHKKEAIAGVIYHPILNQTFYALKDGGAFMDGKEIKVNNVTDRKKLNIILTFNYKTTPDKLSKMMGIFYGGGYKRIMNDWSAALQYCLLASGKVESMITDGIELHDFAAGKLIAIEAGAKALDFEGNTETEYTNTRFILSNTNEINKYIFDVMKPLRL